MYILEIKSESKEIVRRRPKKMRSRKEKVPAVVQRRKSDKDYLQKVLKMRQKLDLFGFKSKEE